MSAQIRLGFAEIGGEPLKSRCGFTFAPVSLRVALDRVVDLLVCRGAICRKSPVLRRIAREAPASPADLLWLLPDLSRQHSWPGEGALESPDGRSILRQRHHRYRTFIFRLGTGAFGPVLERHHHPERGAPPDSNRPLSPGAAPGLHGAPDRSDRKCDGGRNVGRPDRHRGHPPGLPLQTAAGRIAADRRVRRRIPGFQARNASTRPISKRASRPLKAQLNGTFEIEIKMPAVRHLSATAGTWI